MRTLNDARKEIDRIDREMLRLFEMRTQVSREIYRIKEESGAPIRDLSRERERIRSISQMTADRDFAPLCVQFEKSVMCLSRTAQSIEKYHTDETLCVCHGKGCYPVRVREGAAREAVGFFALTGRVLIVTDDGVPKEHLDSLLDQYPTALVFSLSSGEKSKTMENVVAICKMMADANFDRSDAIVALGGGVVCDLAGLAGALYKRGIDCHLIPTTLLAQADACVGGKTAANLNGIKNALGVISAPKTVLIDPLLLRTLPPRYLACGMAECFKIALCFDADLFRDLSAVPPFSPPPSHLLLRVIDLKRRIVEMDEDDLGLRRSLNFGHTIGHAVEAVSDGKRMHGECVALGMLSMSSDAVRDILRPLFVSWGLPCTIDVRPCDLLRYIREDKKAIGERLKVVYCNKIGTYNEAEEQIDALAERAERLSYICPKA